MKENYISEIEINNKKYKFYDIKRVKNVEKFPFSIRILLENIIRNFDGFLVNEEHLNTILNYSAKNLPDKEIPYMPARILMQDFTGVPAIVDLASMRDACVKFNKSPSIINPVIPIDLVIDHSVIVESFGTVYAFEKNVDLEYKQNEERYKFLKWAQGAFKNFRVVPPGLGICHQVNLEYLSKVIWQKDDFLYPDTLIGTDSHTPMVNGLGIIGWGVGGIEAEAVMLGQPLYMRVPEVIGLKLTGKLKEGATATDLVLTIAQILRKYGVVDKFVEVFGPGLEYLTVPDRATISNMSPEFGCTITYFPIDNQTIDYLRNTGRSEELVNIVERYVKENLLWREHEDSIVYTDIIELDLSIIEPSVAGPRRPHDRIPLKKIKEVISTNGKSAKINYGNIEFELKDNYVVISAITSCTNTSNPSVMIGAGLVAKKAIERGLSKKPWVKTSLAPGSRVVTKYLQKANLLPYLEALGFHVVGYGCTTCIGNSGSLPPKISDAIVQNNLNVASVLSGNRNFEARIHPLVKMNFLMSPLLVVVYAIVGKMDIDILNEPLDYDSNGEPVYLRDIWPSLDEISSLVNRVLSAEDFIENYKNIFEGDERWKKLEVEKSELYKWDEKSTYIKRAPYFDDMKLEIEKEKDILNARVLVMLGDSITTDHISPAGSIHPKSPAGEYLISKNVEIKDFNSYGSRRGNHEVMVRGTFANVRLRNLLVDKEGWWTVYLLDNEEMTIYSASLKYRENGIPLIVLAGKEYGSGSSRDWAAKGPYLLGIKAVIAESFERIHRSNLVGMGILPLQFIEGESYKSLGLTGREIYNIKGISEGLKPRKILKVEAIRDDNRKVEFEVICRLDSNVEVEYYRNGGILQYVLRKFLKNERIQS
ncbi:MAG: aconitate hydratase AcnA [candidate division WOR-3 bacterium]|nr:aconitate hydratase AcnA [candidate division WOR-3 bacterium]MCX7947964.1 aconitate hydratase AcnA [candidate division WOR-3 bacterium]MDW8150908.1 aconitate hydratase AcnA [candidate division WOR-3 bacterium]